MQKFPNSVRAFLSPVYHFSDRVRKTHLLESSRKLIESSCCYEFFQFCQWKWGFFLFLYHRGSADSKNAWEEIPAFFWGARLPKRVENRLDLTRIMKNGHTSHSIDFSRRTRQSHDSNLTLEFLGRGRASPGIQREKNENAYHWPDFTQSPLNHF